MKLTRLCTYAIAGIITGLIIENSSLRISQKAGRKARGIKKKLDRRISG